MQTADQCQLMRLSQHPLVTAILDWAWEWDAPGTMCACSFAAWRMWKIGRKQRARVLQRLWVERVSGDFAFERWWGRGEKERKRVSWAYESGYWTLERCGESESNQVKNPSFDICTKCSPFFHVCLPNDDDSVQCAIIFKRDNGSYE